jgi:two-component system CheB/CheR fusion protein
MNMLPEVARIRIYGRDITSRVRMEQALRQANDRLRDADQRKNEFLAMLSHELRNPLAPIHTSLHVLAQAPHGSETAQRAQAVIERQTAHMTRMVEDLLDITRISRGKIHVQRKIHDFAALVKGASEDQHALFGASGVGLDVSVPAEPLSVDGDATRLTQVVGNLLHNALKFTPRGGCVRVSLEREGDVAVLRVRDTGAGISHDMLGRIFEPFTQADLEPNRSHGGLGLGLALVKGLVELHGGQVSVASDGPGRGSELTVRLPVAAATSAEPPAPVSVPGIKRRVLVIEDNYDAASSLSEVLEMEDHKVAVAYNGPDGLAKAREFKPDVVLCDIGLPGMDGYEVASALRADDSFKDVYLVALSGYTLPEDLQRAKAAGFDQHMAKPPSLDKLQALLEHPPA